MRQSVCVSLPLHVKRLVGFQLVETGQATIRQGRSFQIRQSRRNGLEILFVPAMVRDLQQGFHHPFGFPTGDRGRLELAGPDPLQVDILLLRPRRLWLGHLCTDQKVAQLLQGLKTILSIVNPMRHFQGFHQRRSDPVVQVVEIPILLDPSFRLAANGFV